VIVIAESRETININTDISTWDEQFKKAIKKGIKPETDVWDGMQNQFDEEGWT
jgi:hypothetical protein